MREWFADFDAEVWDRQFEADVQAGKLDAMAERALRDHLAGHSTKLRITTPRLIFGPAIKFFPLR